ncbi:MAG: signal peptidase II [Treponema sp.]|nr:MAG: signal peptidase II [Treponema sp.]
MNEKFNKKEVFLPLLLTVLAFAFDQVTKVIVYAKAVPYQIHRSFFNGLFNIRLVFNKGAAFSLGSNFSETIRIVVLGTLPLIALVVIFIFYVKTKELTYMQRWFIAGILGGGLGNIFDRLVRPEGVVDFLDVKFFGIFGLERWPTFNVADSIVVVCGICLILTLLFGNKNSKQDTQAKD